MHNIRPARHGLSRRSLLAAGASAPLLAITPMTRSSTASHSPRAPGIQLYTLRQSMAEDLPGTLQAVAGMGYREVEFAGYFDIEPARIRGYLDGLGLKAPSGHFLAGTIAGELDSVIDIAAALGHHFVTVSWMPPEDRQTLDDWKRWAEVFNRSGERVRQAGLQLAYHNHDFEFTPVGGEMPLRILLSGTEPELMDFELDFYWATRGGQDVVDVLSWAAERFVMAHIKDMNAGGDMTEVGTGRIDFARILANDAARHLRHFFVEHDTPPDAFKTAAIGIGALRKFLQD